METANVKVFVWTVVFALAIIVAGCIAPTMSAGIAASSTADVNEGGASMTTIVVEQNGQPVEDFEAQDVHIHIAR